MVLKCLKFFFGLVFLVTVIHGNLRELEEKLKEMARKSKKIGDLFMPHENGTIVRYGSSLIYKGERVADHHPVVFKFMGKEHKIQTDREFEMYSYLNATNNNAVEGYGISAIHNYQEWEGFMLTIFSFFDGRDLFDLCSRGYFEHTNERLAINSLILFRNFVLQSKYIHSRGVRHDDIKPPNIVVRLGRSFLIDFNSASKMTEDDGSGTSTFSARAVYSKEIRNPKSDWESFLYTMAFINKIELGWLLRNQFVGIDSTTAFTLLGELKCNTDTIIANIENAPIRSEQLKTVFLAFAGETFDDSNPVPNYDQLYELITAQIEQLIEPHQDALFTWIDDNEEEAAMNDLEQASFNIAEIPDPLDDFNLIEFPSHQSDFFRKPNLMKRGNILSRKR